MPKKVRTGGAVSWQVRWTNWDPIAQKTVGERKRKFPTKREAEEFIAREWGVVRSDLAAMHLQRFIEKYEDEILWGLASQQTAANYRGHHRLRIIPTLGRIRLNELTSLDIERAQAKWAADGTTYTVLMGTRSALSRALNHAVEMDAIQANVVLKARKPAKGVERDVLTLTPDELRIVLVKLAEKDQLYADMALVAALTGLRAGELLALQHGDIDPSVGRVMVRRAWSGVGKTRELKPPKNGKTRTAPWPADLHEVLERRWRPEKKHRTGFFFTGVKGGQLRHANVLSRSGFRDIVKELGHPNFHWHDLRATAIVTWIRAGIPLMEVRELAGHSSLRQTDRYARVARNDHAEAVVQLNLYLARTSTENEGRETAES
ncbi:tyrosine-type recombinase/integrase [Gordonia polyisoprenivorans]|uniref:Site-specific integrase n=1 Tax=Gordonia polyisoprenivorans TaxID=84595 RepID=A0A846WTA3_9ACTN|nr:site-specific integrase [Gordonia polyisoprenivorans]NKY04367.1 site-specific integrase [Gordonia polyisoprenivorans]